MWATKGAYFLAKKFRLSTGSHGIPIQAPQARRMKAESLGLIYFYSICILLNR